MYIELPQTDMEVSEGDAIGAVESVKSASDILTPIAGTVAEVNSELEKKPANINKDPEGESWIAKITVSGEPAGKMMSKEEYTAFTEAYLDFELEDKLILEEGGSVTDSFDGKIFHRKK